MITRLSLSQETLSTDDRNDSKQVDEADGATQEFRLLEIGSGQRVDREEAKIHHCNEKGNTDQYYSYMIQHNWRDYPGPSLVSVRVLRNRVNTYAARITKMIADIEDRHHGPSDAMHNPPCTQNLFKNIRVEDDGFSYEDGNPARANINKSSRYLKDGNGDGNSQSSDIK
ncbi:hypothetical protein Tco_0464758 [Tanacetum coccineum]